MWTRRTTERSTFVDAAAFPIGIFAVARLPIRPKDAGKGVPSIIYIYRDTPKPEPLYKTTWCPLSLAGDGEVAKRVFVSSPNLVVMFLSDRALYTAQLASGVALRHRSAIFPDTLVGADPVTKSVALVTPGLRSNLTIDLFMVDSKLKDAIRLMRTVTTTTKVVHAFVVNESIVGLVSEDGRVKLVQMRDDMKFYDTDLTTKTTRASRRESRHDVFADATAPIRKVDQGVILNVRAVWIPDLKAPLVTMHVRNERGDAFVFRGPDSTYTVRGLPRLTGSHRPFNETGDDFVFKSPKPLDQAIRTDLWMRDVFISDQWDVSEEVMSPRTTSLHCREKGLFFGAHVIFDRERNPDTSVM